MMAVMDRESFRYYLWRTVFGGKLWALDADWYRMLGALYLQDLGPDALKTDGQWIETDDEPFMVPYGFTRCLHESFMRELVKPSRTAQAFEMGLLRIESFGSDDR